MSAPKLARSRPARPKAARPKAARTRLARSRLLRRGVLAALALAAAAALAVSTLWIALPDAAPLAKENPRTTALVEQRRAEAKARRRPFRPLQTWVALDRISPRLVQAVLLSEDASFFGHAGIDWTAIRDAAEHDLRVGRFARGASTITQQLAKNLWLGTEKSLWRKVKEAMLAAKLERAVPKRRILALYLNVVELDDQVFGAEAGARHRFGVAAADLSIAQAVVLASSLPAPRKVELAHPSTWLRRRARALLDRLHSAGRISPAEHLHASAELDRILAGPAPAEDPEEPPDDEGARSAVDAASRARAPATETAAAERGAEVRPAAAEGAAEARPAALEAYAAPDSGASGGERAEQPFSAAP